MSRVAKDPVSIPESVNLTTEGKTINFKGPKGEMSLVIHETVDFAIEENTLQVKWKLDEERAMAGTMRALINNYVKGVSEGFEKKVKLNGVGYRAKVQGKKITFTLGFSHPVDYDLPETVEAKQDSQTELTLSSCNKQLLGQVCAEIRSFRPPEPYKGKGIFIDGEQIARKERKKAAAAG
jgi:large subunit ribosomal protein L6